MRFGNAFAGFDLATAVTTVVIDRTDTTPFFTFVDNERSESATATVPEPASLLLLGAAARAAGADSPAG